MSDYEHMKNHIVDGYLSSDIIWKMRDLLDPPTQGYVMWSIGGWKENVEHLVERFNIPEEDIRLVRYGESGCVCCWIPYDDVKAEVKRLLSNVPWLRRRGE